MDNLDRMGLSADLLRELDSKAVDYLAKGLDAEAIARMMEGVAKKMRDAHKFELERRKT